MVAKERWKWISLSGKWKSHYRIGDPFCQTACQVLSNQCSRELLSRWDPIHCDLERWTRSLWNWTQLCHNGWRPDRVWQGSEQIGTIALKKYAFFFFQVSDPDIGVEANLEWMTGCQIQQGFRVPSLKAPTLRVSSFCYGIWFRMLLRNYSMTFQTTSPCLIFSGEWDAGAHLAASMYRSWKALRCAGDIKLFCEASAFVYIRWPNGSYSGMSLWFWIFR